MQEGFCGAAVGHQQPDGLRIGPEVFVPLAALGHRQVDHVVEVGWETIEVTCGQVDRLAPHPRLLEVFTHRGIGEPGDPPDFVIDRQGFGDGSGNLSGWTGDQNLGTAHGLMVCDR